MLNFSRVEKIREEKKITIREMCKLTGFTENAYQKMKSRGNPTVESISRIADVLGVHVSEFFDDAPSNPPHKKHHQPSNTIKKDGVKCSETNMNPDLMDKLLQAKDTIIEVLQKSSEQYQHEIALLKEKLEYLNKEKTNTQNKNNGT